MAKVARIVSLGSALQDLYLIDRDDFIAHEDGDREILGEIAIGSKVDIDRIAYSVGGGGTNSAVTFARHGHQAIFIGNIGHDAAGEAVLACLDTEGVDNSYVSYAPHRNTGCSVILLDTKSGERTILTHRGASAKFDNLSAGDLDLIQPDWLYVTSLRGDIDTLVQFVERAHRLGARVMLNPGKLELKHKRRLLNLLPRVDVLLVNKREAMQLVPGNILTELLARLANYTQTVIITDGQMGAIATNHLETYRFGLYEDLPVKDTTGAGDAFGAGFLAHLAAGQEFKKSLVFAAANATFVVSKLGAKAGILTGTEKLHQMPIQRL